MATTRLQRRVRLGGRLRLGRGLRARSRLRVGPHALAKGMLEGLPYVAILLLLLLLLLLLVLFLILLFIFLFPLCESRLSTRQSKVDGTLASGSLAIMLSLHAPRRQTSGVRSCANPPPLATARHRQPNWQRPNGTRSRRSAPLFSMSPNRAILSERSNFYGRLPVGAPGRVAGGNLRRAQPSQVAHGCAPTRERLRGDFLVERNSFRFSVALVPFEQANRSAGKKRNEFRSTAPGPRVLGKGQSWLMVAHQPPSRGAEGPPAFRHQENVAPGMWFR